MNYRIDVAAKELMLSPDELKEVLEIFFAEAGAILAQCQDAVQRRDHVQAAKFFHSVKGSAGNLGMNDLASMARDFEMKAQRQELSEIQSRLPEMQKALRELEEVFVQYFRMPTNQ